MAKGYYEMQMPDGEKYRPIQGYTWAVGSDNASYIWRWYKFLEISNINGYGNFHLLLYVQHGYRQQAWGILRINFRLDNGVWPAGAIWDFSWLLRTDTDDDTFSPNIIKAVISEDRKKVSFYARANPTQYGRTCFTVLYSSGINGNPIEKFSDYCISSTTPEETDPSEMTGVSLVKEPSVAYQSKVENNTLKLNL